MRDREGGGHREREEYERGDMLWGNDGIFSPTNTGLILVPNIHPWHTHHVIQIFNRYIK